MPDKPSPPGAERRPTPLTHHGDERVDDYYWLRDRDNPTVIDYLKAENAYTESMTAHTAEFRQRLFAEIRSRIQETDTSAPAPHGPFSYYHRTVEGLQYPIHCRRARDVEDLDHTEEVILDENALAGDREFFALGVLETSPDHRILAYSTDFEGDEAYTLRFRDLARGTDLSDTITNTYYSAAWANDNATIFYTVLDDAKRPWQVWRHRLGTDRALDVLIHQEDDDAFFADIDRTRSGHFLVLSLGSMVTSEVWIGDADDPTGSFRLIEPRRHAVEYAVDHQHDRLLIVTNDDGAVNFKLMSAPVDAPGRENWTEVIGHRDDARVEGVQAFAKHVAVSERAGGLRQFRILVAGGMRSFDMPEPVFTAMPGPNFEFETEVLRFQYTSLVTPPSDFDLEVASGTRVLVKQQPVLGGYDADLYETSRLWATAADGAAVPISLVRRRDLVAGPLPTLLYGYGSYEASTDPAFSSLRLSLLDRGVAFAIAHTRGGGEMGRRWYEGGKFLNKRNTFTDFITCAEHLIAEGITATGKLAARGGSAGGMLMGAVANMRPDLFRAIVAEVPFVDCLTTILDESLPLTVIEWDEWGNPNEREFYDYMKTYSPYDNVVAQDYPAMLVTAGLNDPRVSYWEPAKWVAKLRALKTDSNVLLLKTEMGAGHMGPSGRYEVWKDEAFVYAFILDALGVASI